MSKSYVESSFLYTLWTIPRGQWSDLPIIREIDDAEIQRIKEEAAKTDNVDKNRLKPYQTPISEETMRQIIE